MTQLVPGAAVITGGGSGIGRAIALALATRAPLAILDLQPKGGEETVSLIEAAGGRAGTSRSMCATGKRSTAPTRKLWGLSERSAWW